MESGERSVLGFDPFSGGLKVLPSHRGPGNPTLIGLRYAWIGQPHHRTVVIVSRFDLTTEAHSVLHVIDGKLGHPDPERILESVLRHSVGVGHGFSFQVVFGKDPIDPPVFAGLPGGYETMLK